MVILNFSGLFNNSLVSICYTFCEKFIPFAISKGEVIKQFKLLSEICYQCSFIVHFNIFISLGSQLPDKLPLKFRLALILFRTDIIFSCIFSNNRCFVSTCNDVVYTHAVTSLNDNSLSL